MGLGCLFMKLGDDEPPGNEGPHLLMDVIVGIAPVVKGGKHQSTGSTRIEKSFD